MPIYQPHKAFNDSYSLFVDWCTYLFMSITSIEGAKSLQAIDQGSMPRIVLPQVHELKIPAMPACFHIIQFWKQAGNSQIL